MTISPFPLCTSANIHSKIPATSKYIPTFFLFCLCFIRLTFLGEPATFAAPLSPLFSAIALALLLIALLAPLFTGFFGSPLLGGSSDSLSESESDLEQGLSELELRLEPFIEICCLLLGFGSLGLLLDFRTAAMVSRRLLAWVLVTENSGDGLREEDSWLELELSESEESDWLQEAEALPEF